MSVPSLRPLILVIVVQLVTALIPVYAEFSPVDLGVFTVIDPDDHLTIDAGRVDWFNLSRGDDAGLIINMGEGYFGDFEHRFEFGYTEIEAGGGESKLISYLWEMSNSLDYPDDAKIVIWPQQVEDQDDVFTLTFKQEIRNKPVINFRSSHVYEAGKPYYLRVQREKDTLRMLTYSDADYSKLIEDTGLLEGLNTTYRFLEIAQQRSANVDTSDLCTGYMQGFSMSGEPLGHPILVFDTHSIEVLDIGTDDVGQLFKIGLHISGAEDLKGIHMELTYDDSVIEYYGGSINESFAATVRGIEGTVLNATLTEPFDGYALAFTLAFEVVRTGETHLITDAELKDSEGTQITSQGDVLFIKVIHRRPWDAETFQQLQEAYEQLEDKYGELDRIYEELVQNYQGLEEAKEALEVKLEDIQSEYGVILDETSALREEIEEISKQRILGFSLAMIALGAAASIWYFSRRTY